MLCKDIKAIVDLEPELDLGRQVAHNSANDTVDDGRPGGNETRGGSDSDKASNSTTAEANCTPLPLNTVVHQAPGETTNAGSNVGDNTGHNSTQVRSERTTAVETEPADPEEDGAEDDMGDVVRAVREAMAVVVPGALAKHERVGEGGGAGRDVDGRTTGKVETTQLEGPAVGVPGPVGDGIVDDGGPDEDEDQAGQKTASVSSSSDSKGGTAIISHGSMSAPLCLTRKKHISSKLTAI